MLFDNKDKQFANEIIDTNDTNDTTDTNDEDNNFKLED
jgi:hypothetical protein